MILTAELINAKPIQDFPEYLITERGIIIRDNNIKYTEFDKDNYLRVQLWKGGHFKWFRVHRLVVEHYPVVRKLDNWYEVHHIDHNRTNNYYKNLRVMFRYEHMAEFHGWQKIDEWS